MSKIQLPQKTLKILNEEVKPYEKYMRKKLISDGYRPAPNLSNLTVQFYNLYAQEFENVLSENPDAGFFKDLWKGIKKGFNSIRGVVDSISGLITNIGNSASSVLGQVTGGGQNPEPKNNMNTILLVGGLGVAAYLLMKNKSKT